MVVSAVGVAAAPLGGGAPAGAASPDEASDPESGAVAEAAHQEPAVPGTPCGVSVRACVDLESQRAWLVRDGEVVGGPMPISSGGAGSPTPIGHSYRVYRKDKDHRSDERRMPNGEPAPMPYTTFFGDGGVGFHAGDPDRSSAGCIHLEPADAEAVFDDLQEGDKVQVLNASKEAAEREAAGAPSA